MVFHAVGVAQNWAEIVLEVKTMIQDPKIKKITRLGFSLIITPYSDQRQRCQDSDTFSAFKVQDYFVISFEKLKRG